MGLKENKKEKVLNEWLAEYQRNFQAGRGRGMEGTKKELLIVYKVNGEKLVGKGNKYMLDEFIEKRVNPIYEKYPYAQVRIEVMA